MTKMLGKRVDRPDGSLFAVGDYGKGADGKWFACCPGNLLAGLANHEVVEHDDGSITVNPSILVGWGSGGDGQWHGHIKSGWFEWEESR